MDVIDILIRAQVEPDQRHELMQMCKSWLASPSLQGACLERRVYEDAISPKDLLLIEQWSDETALNAYLSSDSFRALVGAIKVLGRLEQVCTCEAHIVEKG
jgi:quinol monooxygenase YgiN